MITREQAEQAVHARYDQHNATTVYTEIRNIQMEEFDSQQINAEEDLGQFDIEDRCWKCTFEIRYRALHLGQWTGRYVEDWRKETCYIVEPKPGPYVIVD